MNIDKWLMKLRIGRHHEVSCVYLVSQLIETAIFASHEDPAVVWARDVQYMGVVSGDSEQRLWQQMHLPEGWPWRRTTKQAGIKNSYRKVSNRRTLIFIEVKQSH